MWYSTTVVQGMHMYACVLAAIELHHALMTRWLHELCPLHAGGRERDWELQFFTIGIEESIGECGEEVFGVLISVYRYLPCKKGPMELGSWGMI